MNLSTFKVLTFDCYGTLIDWESAIGGILSRWAARRGVRLTDEELLTAFADAEQRAERAHPDWLYPAILRSVMSTLAQRYNVTLVSSDGDMLAESVGEWLPFPDTIAALRQLKLRHKLVIISNVDRASFARTQKQLGVEFDLVVTAEDVGAYKPDLRPFRRALELLAQQGIDPSAVLHVAQSLYHDHAPAKRLGLSTVWINRRLGKPGWGATPAPAGNVMPDLSLKSLAELVTREERERTTI